jgi:UDP-3-O-[3-hydroxymyristoyl] N-acetylglucosamine deacetylase
MNQRTLKNPCQFVGVGIHSGKETTLRCFPAPADFGIVFNKTTKVSPENLRSTPRATLLGDIFTPEHFLSACFGLGITNLECELDGSEIPILDGSALEFVLGFENAGIHDVETRHAASLQIGKPIVIDNCLIALPSDRLIFSYVLDYPDSFIGQQTYTYIFDPHTYKTEIAPARTFGFEKEVKALLERGLAQGGSIDNAVVIGEKNYLNKLRFPDELVRHKILDMIGDLSVLGRYPQCHFVGIKSGHAQNMKMVRLLA